MRKRFAEIFRSKTRDEWCELLEGTDVCFAPVLPMSEAMKHPGSEPSPPNTTTTNTIGPIAKAMAGSVTR